MDDLLAARHVLLAGATGLVDREALRSLPIRFDVAAVHVPVRRPIEVAHPKPAVHRAELGDFPLLPAPPHEVYLALGTTIKVAGSQAACRAVDFDPNLAVARSRMPQACAGREG